MAALSPSDPASPQQGPSAGAGDGLTRAPPSRCGVDAAHVQAFLEEVAAAGLDLHSLMVFRDGAVAAEWFRWPYGPRRPRIMHSAAKSFTACAIGMLVDEGRLSLTDKVVDYFPEHAPEHAESSVDANLAAMTVEDLMTMRCGHGEETSGSIWRGISTSWTAEFFKIPVVHRPGGRFLYTSAASYMLSAIVTKITGETLHAYLKPRLFEPLGIVGETWDIGPDGVNPGGNGLTCTTADLLKLTILHVQKGVWNGRRLLSEDWVARATRSYGDDYGYQWWTGEHGCFYAIGQFVQMGIGFPEQGAAIAVTSAIDNSKLLLPHIYRHFPAAFGGPGVGPEADTALSETMAAMSRPEPMASLAEPRPEYAGRQVYRICDNALGVTQIELDCSLGRCDLALTDGGGRHTIEVGVDRWIEGETGMPGADLHHGYRLDPARVVAGARWLNPDTLQMSWIFAESAFRDTVTCHFTPGRLSVQRAVNVNTGAMAHPALTGHLVRSE